VPRILANCEAHDKAARKFEKGISRTDWNRRFKAQQEACKASGQTERERER
jgi:hypothetical protein